MYRFAMIKNGLVENVVLWDKVAPWSPGEEWTVDEVPSDLPVDVGWQYSQGVFSPPEPEEGAGQ